MYLGLKAGKNYGWGVCSEHLVRELSRLVPVQVLNGDKLDGRQTDLPGKLFQALANVHLLALFEGVRGKQNYGYTFFENELTHDSVENARKYDLILAGSSWCRQRLVEKGITNCDVLIQGIDPQKFHPIANGGSDRHFVIFSGGKFELRKGQDLILRAVKVLQEKYDDVILVNCWYNLWPESIQSMAVSEHITLPGKTTDSWIPFIEALCKINGLDIARVKTLELVPNYILREIFRQTDIGLFSNRCEGGTNLVLMEYMACARPVIASNTSGHRDIVNDSNALLLNDLRDIHLKDSRGNLAARWQEPNLDEIVAQLEYAYHHRNEISRLGRKAGEDLKKFTWKHTAKRLLQIIATGEGDRHNTAEPADSRFAKEKHSGLKEPWTVSSPGRQPGLGEVAGEETSTWQGHCRLGQLYRRQGNLEQALTCFQKALGFDPTQVEPAIRAAEILEQQGALDKALEQYHGLLNAHPTSAWVLNRIGDIYKQQHKFKKAVFWLEKAAALKTDMPEVFFNLGYAYAALEKYQQAIRAYHRVLEIEPLSAKTLYNLAELKLKINRPVEAVDLARRAVEIEPDHLEANNNLGNYLRALGDPVAAIEQYQKTLKIDETAAHIHLNLALALLLCGRYKHGWREYEWRMQVNGYKEDYRYHGNPLWDGKPLAGKRLLVHGDQGLGDAIQFVRYLPLVKKNGGTVLFETRRELIPLFREFPGIDELLERPPSGVLPVQFDCYIPLCSIPGRLGTRLDTIPAEIPYLSPPAQNRIAWRHHFQGPGFKIGFAWTGNQNHIANQQRSCRLEDFFWLQQIPGTSLLSMQRELSPKEAGQLEKTGIVNLGPQFNDFGETAAVIAELDLLITVDTAVAHLAGAMGKPVWILLPFDPDWRWLLKRHDSPWYPTARLFRQPQPGNWDHVMGEVRRKLMDLMKTHDPLRQFTEEAM